MSTGWRVIEVWGHEVDEQLEESAARVVRAFNATGEIAMQAQERRRCPSEGSTTTLR